MQVMRRIPLEGNISALAFLMLTVYGFYRAFPVCGLPANVQVIGSDMLVFDASSHEIWRHAFPVFRSCHRALPTFLH